MESEIWKVKLNLQIDDRDWWKIILLSDGYLRNTNISAM